MEEKTTIFHLSIDETTRSHLSDVAKWTRVFAIAGFIFLVLMMCSGILASIRLNNLEERFGDQIGSDGQTLQSRVITAAIINYAIILLVWFFPLFYLLRFSNHMNAAIDADDKNRLDSAFQYLKICFRYLGIVIVISLVIYGMSAFLGITLRSLLIR